MEEGKGEEGDGEAEGNEWGRQIGKGKGRKKLRETGKGDWKKVGGKEGSGWKWRG